jgi:uncharacterized membrane protein YhhN
MLVLIATIWGMIDNPRHIDGYLVTLVAMAWLAAVAWLARRIIRRHREATPHS